LRSNVNVVAKPNEAARPAQSAECVDTHVAADLDILKIHQVRAFVNHDVFTAGLDPAGQQVVTAQVTATEYFHPAPVTQQGESLNGATKEWPFNPAIFHSDLFQADGDSSIGEAMPKMKQAIPHLRADWLAKP
jgi:hypothetical protein